MGKTTGIEWCDATWNPWWGCTKVSAGCTNCYADTLASRYGHSIWGPKAPRRFFGDKHWQEPLKWDRAAREAGVRRRVFCASMADMFEDHMLPAVNVDLDDARERLWTLIEGTWSLDWLLLTKRPENVLRMVSSNWLYKHVGFPPNVWIGTSVENQEQAEARIPELLKIPAHVRFLSCEPLLGPLDLTPWLQERSGNELWAADYNYVSGIDWVIGGGESGARYRPCDPAWARSLRDQCVAAGIAYFWKQWGGRVAKSGGHLLDGQEWHQFPTPLVPE